MDDSKQMEVVGISFPCKDEPLLKVWLALSLYDSAIFSTGTCRSSCKSIARKIVSNLLPPQFVITCKSTLTFLAESDAQVFPGSIIYLTVNDPMGSN